jgi:thiamine kinase-like enzyme
MQTSSILEEPRPWPFSKAQLTAGLRSHTGDNRLSVREIKEFNLPVRRPSIGRIRGIHVTCQASTGQKKYDLVLKEPQGTTRAGMAGAGRREVSFYRCLGEQIPIHIPQILASQADGEWMLFELLPSGISPDAWGADEYLLAIDNLVLLHDRFWSLNEFLDIYNWLGRPLTRDFEIFKQAASNGIQRFSKLEAHPVFNREPGFIQMLECLVEQAKDIANELKTSPFTLMHGDYWPGNIMISSEGRLMAYDWQHASIGPGILDLVKFYQASQWEFAAVPLSQTEIVTRYRDKLRDKNGVGWLENDWQRQWDYGLLWTFLTDWVDLLAQTPTSIVETRRAQIESIWLGPVTEAFLRRLKLS